MFWLVRKTLFGAPRRLLLAAVAAALPVGALAATLLYVDDSLSAMTRVALAPVQVEMRAIAGSLDTDMRTVAGQLSAVPGVDRAELFGSADVLVSAPGGAEVSARLFAVDPSYLRQHRWVHITGALGAGALLDAAVAAVPGFAHATSVSVRPAAGAGRVALPITGRVDLRDATTWFAIPTGDVQGDIAAVPRAILVDYRVFERRILSALRASRAGPANVTNPGLSGLPPASNEVHLTVNHSRYPADPAAAGAWSANLRRALGRAAPATLVIADNAAEPLSEAAVDATNAKILFLLLGIPGALVAGALGLAAGAALVEAHRREDALLTLRGATDTQLLRFAVGQGLLAAAVGTVVGLAAAAAGVSWVIGHPVWRDIGAGHLAQTLTLAVGAGAIATAARLVPLRRASRRTAIMAGRRQLRAEWRPAWLRTRLDLVALSLAAVVLAVNLLVGGLKPSPVEGQTLALAFYVLLAPIALWIGTVLVAVRLMLMLLGRAARPERHAPLTSWSATAVRWFARRPARTTVAVVLGSLAVAFGTQVATFVATFDHAKRADARAAFGADLRLTSVAGAAPSPSAAPDGTAQLAATTPIRDVPARAGSDRKTMLAIDVNSYRRTVAARPEITRGRGLDALAGDPSGVLIAEELAQTLHLSVGEQFSVTVFPDDDKRLRNLAVHVVGVYRAFPPTDPLSELVATTAALPSLPDPDFYLARVASGSNPDDVARALRGSPGAPFAVTTLGDSIRKEQRSLTAVNLDGLSRIEMAASVLVAALGVGVLAAFIVLERRREFAVLRAVGAERRQVLTGPVIEGAFAALASVGVGTVIGLGLGVLSVRVLGLFFTLRPPLVVVPVGAFLTVAAAVLAASAIALGIALRSVSRAGVGDTLREP